MTTALRLIKDNPLAKVWYTAKVEREGNKRKKKAIVALMRKLSKALWHIARGARFDARLLFDESRLQPWLQQPQTT